MQSDNWKSFVETLISNFRQEFSQKVTTKDLALLESNKTLNNRVKKFYLSKPCQIIILNFLEPNPIVFIILHENEAPDGDFKVYEQLTSLEDVTSRLNGTKPDWLNALESEAQEIQKPDYVSAASPGKNYGMIKLTTVENRKKPNYLLEQIFDYITFWIKLEHREHERKNIEKSALKLRENANLIGKPEVKKEILQSANDIDRALETIEKLNTDYDKRFGIIENELGGVRKLIGTTKEYQEFTVLVSAVDDIKKNHVDKQVFEEVVKRIEQRIDGVNTRIEDMKSIKFWSKRTIVDIILGALATTATIVAALFAAGVL